MSEGLREILAAGAVEGARALLGCTLVSPVARGVIVETEAYRGADDPGCHAFGKERMANMALFGPPGTAYVYLSYGVHWLLNVVAEPEGVPAGVLIRAAAPIGEAREGWRGPGVLGRAFGVGPQANGLDLLNADAPLQIRSGTPVRTIATGPRVGLAAGKGDELPWRFADAERLRWVSRPIRSLVVPTVLKRRT